MFWSPLSQMMLLDANAQMVVVTRRPESIGGAIQVVAGLRVQSAEVPAETFETKVVVHPMTGRDLAIMSEGDRVRESVWVFQRGTDPLLVAVGDVLALPGGKSFHIQMLESWGPYIRASALLVDSQPMPVV